MSHADNTLHTLFENIVQFSVYIYNIMFRWAVLSIKYSEVIGQKPELPVFDPNHLLCY
jgi:hypothetical protein